jgi:signal transduction histidine kinase
MKMAMAASPEYHGDGRRYGAFDGAREAAFAEVSRELRFCLDHDGCVTYADGAWHQTVGRAPRALLGKRWTALVAGVDHAPMRVAIERAHSLGTVQPELVLRMNAAAAAHPLVHWTLAPGRGGHWIVAVGYERTAEHRAAAEARGDVAQLQRRVAELEARVDDLSDHSRSMEGFAATAAHQLSEPLIVAESGAIMVAEELGEALDDDLRARLDAIGRGAARARQTIDALLMDARSANGVELEPVRTERVVADVLEEMSLRMRQRGVVADVGTLPMVRAERRLVAVIYQNLISNALKYGPREGGSLRIDAEPVDEGWRLIVESGGAPLPADQTRRIFEPWHRLPGERRGSGSGLGLAICARLIDRLGGSIGVEPKPNGNAFYFTLPAALEALPSDRAKR